MSFELDKGYLFGNGRRGLNAAGIATVIMFMIYATGFLFLNHWQNFNVSRKETYQ